MSKIVFDKLQIEYFSCIKYGSISLNNVGLCAIEGRVYDEEEIEEENVVKYINDYARSNGAGKSSIVESFYFGVTGEFFDNDTTLLSVINRFSNKPAVIRITGYRDETQFMILRTVHCKSKRSKKAEHTLEFEIGDDKIHEKTNSIIQTQERINEFLGISPLLLLNSRIFGQGDISSFTAVNDRQKKIIIDNLVGIGVCDRLYKTTTKSLTEITTAMTAISIELLNVQKLNDTIYNEYVDLKGKDAEWEKIREEEITVVEKKIKETGDKLLGFKKVISACDMSKEELVTMIKDINSIKEELQKAEILLVPIEEKINYYNEERIKLDRESNYYLGIQQRIETEIVGVQKLFKDEGKQICPTCHQNLEQKNYERIKQKQQSELDETLKAFNQHKKGIEGADKSYKEWKKLKVILDQKIQTLKNDIEKAEVVNKKVEDVENKKQRATQATETLEIEYKNIIEEKEKILQKPSPYQSLIADKKKQLSDFRTDIKDKATKIEKLEKDKKYLTLLNKAFNKDGIPRLISNDVLKVLNRLLKKYQSRILGEGFEIEYKMRERRKNEEICLQVSNPKGGQGYSRQSKGEKRKVDLCQMFAISDFARMQNRCDINVLWLDEVFSELDIHSCEIVLDIIKEHPANSKFIITHKNMFKDEFRSRIYVEKRNQLSTVTANY